MLDNNSMYFSIVIPLYNKESTILSTVQSVLAQTYEKFELLVVDDGSTDNSLQLVSSIVDQRLRIIRKKNGGVSSARNKGIEEAKNSYIAFLDADDLWTTNHLSILCQMIQMFPDDVMYYTRYGSLEQSSNFNLEVKRTESYLFEFLHGNVACSSTVCLNRKYLLENHLFFNEILTHGEDMDFWYRVSSNIGAVFCTAYTAIYRQGIGNQATSYLPKNLLQHYSYTIEKKEFANIEYGKEYYYKIVSFLLKPCLRKVNIKLLFKLISKHGFFVCFHVVCLLIKEKLSKK